MQYPTTNTIPKEISPWSMISEYACPPLWPMLTRVAVQVNVDRNRLAHMQPQQQLLERVHCRVQLRRWPCPTPIEVDGRERAPIVATDDAVGIKHRHDKEKAVASQRVRLRRAPRQEVDDTLRRTRPAYW